jgi:hypothetical protein
LGQSVVYLRSIFGRLNKVLLKVGYLVAVTEHAQLLLELSVIEIHDVNDTPIARRVVVNYFFSSLLA